MSIGCPVAGFPGWTVAGVLLRLFAGGSFLTVAQGVNLVCIRVLAYTTAGRLTTWPWMAAWRANWLKG